MWFIIVRMKLPTFHPNLRRYDGQFSLMSTTKTTTLKGAPFTRHTKLSPKPLVCVLNPSVVVPGETAKKGVVDASAKASNVRARALATGTVLQIQTMLNEWSVLMFLSKRF